jgi:hypothetical protein
MPKTVGKKIFSFVVYNKEKYITFRTEILILAITLQKNNVTSQIWYNVH